MLDNDKDLKIVESFTQTVKDLAKEYNVDCVIATGKWSEARGTYVFSSDHVGKITLRLFLEKIIIHNNNNELSELFNPSSNSRSKKL